MSRTVGAASITLEVDAGKLASQLDSAVKSALGRVEGSMGKLSQSMSSVAGDAGRKAAESLTGSVGKAADTAARQASSALAGIGDAAARAGQKAAQNLSSGLGGVGRSASTAAQQAASALGGISTSATNAANQAASAFSGVGSRIRSSLQGAASTASGAFSGLGASMSNAMGSIRSATSGLGARIRADLDTNFRASEASALRIPPAVGQIGAALVAVAGPMKILKGGFDRLMNIQRSEIIFKNIGLTTEETKAQMSKLSEQVTGTSVSLADAARYSAAFAQSGVKMGKPMDDTIKAFTNLSAAAQGSGTDVGLVMQQISAAGRLMGGDAMQLQQAGINIYQFVADYMGKSVSEVKKLGEQGKITFEDVVNSVNAGMGDLAHDMGETLPAKLSNFNTALSNLGAAIIEPFIPGITAAVEFGTALVKWVVKPIKDGVKWIGDLGGVAGGLRDVISTVGVALAGVGIVGFITQLGVVQTALSGIGTAIGAAFTIISGPIGLTVAAIAAVAAVFVTLWKRSDAFRNFWIGLWESIKGAVEPVVNDIKRVLDQLGAAWEELTTAFSGGDFGYGALEQILGAEKAQWIIDQVARVGEALRGMKELAKGVADILFKGEYTGLPFGLDENSPVVTVLTTIRDLAGVVWSAIQRIGEAFADIGKKLAGSGLSVIVSVLSSLWEVIKSLASAIFEIVQALWPVLKPILMVIGAVIGGVIVGAVFALIAALTILSGIFQAVATVISWVMENILSPLITIIGDIISWIVDHLAAAITGFIEWIKDGLEALGSFFSDVWDAIKAVWEWLQPVFSTIGDIILVAIGMWILAFNWLKDKWDELWAGIQIVWDLYGQPVIDTISGWFGWLGEKISEVCGWISARWGELWAWVQQQYDTWIAPILGWIGDKFEWMRDRINGALTFVQTCISAAGARVKEFYDTYVAPMVEAVRGKIDQMVQKFTEIKNRVKGALSDAGQWLVDTGRQIVNGLINGIKGMFGPLIDKVKSLASVAKATAKKALGIHSPSRVFRDIGTNVGEGFAQGLESMTGRVASATTSLAGAANMPTMPTVSAAAAPGGPPATVGTVPEGAAGLGDMALAMSTTAEGVLNPLWAQQNAQVAGFAATTSSMFGGVVIPAWMTMAGAVQATATGALSPTMGQVEASTMAMGAAFPTAVNGQISPALTTLGGALWNVKATGVDPVFMGIQSGLQTVVGAFGTGVNAITAQWSRVREATASPVRFTIQSVFNDGLVGMWNSVAELLGVSRMAAYPVRFATGGLVSGPGGPTDDKVPALLSDGEYVVNAAAVNRIGVRNLNALNSGAVSVAPGVLGNRRQVNEMLRDRTFTSIASRYAGGGLVEGSPAYKALIRAHKFARKWSPRPYVWGGSLGANGGTDCSGWVSSIADVILGGSGMQRQWATMSFPGSQRGAWAPGLAYGYSVGISDPHTAGTLSGVGPFPTVNVESGGNTGQGPTYGGRATGADDPQFPRKWHLRIVDGGRFVPGAGSGVSMADMAASAMKPFRDRMRSALAGMPRSGGTIDTLPPAVASTLQDAAQKKIDKLVEELDTPGGSGVERWAPLVRYLLNLYGHPQSWLGSTLRRMQQESGGNPRAVNNWDVNAKNGDPSKGLMQVIGSTFAAYRDPRFPNDIWNPKANVAASMRYAMSRYGSLPAAYDRAGGYHNGGVLGEGRGLFHKTAFQPERVLSPRQTESFDRLVDWLDATPSPVIRGGRSSGLVGENQTTRQVMVTQNISAPDPVAAADKVEDRLMALMV